MGSFRRGWVAVVVLSVLSLLALGTPAQAAGVRFVDDAGDALDTRASMDIVAASIEIKPMAPRNTPSVVVTLELAGPPEPTGASYEFAGDLASCGGFGAALRQGTAYNVVFGDIAGLGISTHQMWVECGSPPTDTGSTWTFVDLMTSVTGNTITMWSAVANFPKEFAADGEMTGLRAFTQVADPAVGIIGNAYVGATPHDEAATDQTWDY